SSHIQPPLDASFIRASQLLENGGDANDPASGSDFVDSSSDEASIISVDSNMDEQREQEEREDQGPQEAPGGEDPDGNADQITREVARAAENRRAYGNRQTRRAATTVREKLEVFHPEL